MTLARTSSVVVAASLLLLSACGDQERLENLEARVASLEASADKVNKLRASVNVIENRISELEATLDKDRCRFEALEDTAGNRTHGGSLGAALEALRRNFDDLEADLESLKKSRGTLPSQP